MKWQYLYLKLSSRSIGVAYLEIKKDVACMHTELSAVLNSFFVNWYHYWVSRHMFRFFPWNSKSLIVSIPISCNRGYPLWENSIDLSWPITSVQNACLKNIFFFTLSMIITIVISLFQTQVPTNQLVSIGLYIVFNISI